MSEMISLLLALILGLAAAAIVLRDAKRHPPRRVSGDVEHAKSAG
ncbi:hypothetical protein [Mangrovibrevibacter kandeliae]|nr:MULTISPECIES: hypothetical protein [unclassified Aurantimonas]MCQ8781225.1 hypothetical protein [Aurantimonas sp. CSK15Z-1]MCW4114002.1 hypothetical protein [Aurantimonas sp. MSK8Z-1]